MKLLSLLLSKSWRTVALATLCGLVTGAASAGLIAVINRALTRDEHPTAGLAYGFVGLALVVLSSRIASQALLSRIHMGMLFELRMDLCRRILAAPLQRLEQTGVSRVMSILASDVLTISETLLILPQIVINIAIIIGCLCYLAYLSWAVFLGMVLFVVIGVFSYSALLSRVLVILRRVTNLQDNLFKHFRALTDGIKELKLHRRRRAAFLREDLEATASELRRLYTRGSDLMAATGSWGMFLFFGFIGLLLFVFPLVAPVSVQALMGYTLAALYLQQPLDALSANLPFLGRGEVALQKVQSLSLPAASDEAEPAGAPPPATFERIEMVSVTHAYHREQEDASFVLGPIEMSVDRGEVVFLIGGNGSGKTTLAKLLTGLYTPASGEIRLDGQPVTEQTRDTYRQLFATVFSDFYLFDRLLGLVTPDLAPQVQGYLERLHLDRKVTIDPRGTLSTTALSQGQRKRLALLTAYLEDRPFYVFDEWAADQDPAFKEVFYKQLLPGLKGAGKTVLVISHDDRYFHLADRILRLESGKLLPLEAPAPARAAV